MYNSTNTVKMYMPCSMQSSVIETLLFRYTPRRLEYYYITVDFFRICHSQGPIGSIGHIQSLLILVQVSKMKCVAYLMLTREDCLLERLSMADWQGELTELDIIVDCIALYYEALY